jgi:hypothetical protein
MLQLGLTICLFIQGLLSGCVSSYTMVQKLCIPDTRGTNRSFQVLQEYHNVGIFTLLACYVALIGSCRRFGTNYRTLLLPGPSRNVNYSIQYTIPLTLMPEARTAHLSLHHSMTHLHRNANNEAPLYTSFPSLLLLPPFRFQYFPQNTVLKHLLLYSSLNVLRIYKPFPVNVTRTAQITWLLIMQFSQASNYSLQLRSK